MFRIVFKGVDNQSINIGGLLLKANKPEYLENLPMPADKLKALKVIEFSKVEEKAVPKDHLAVAKDIAIARGKRGIMWVGTVSVRVVENLGKFVRDEARFDVSDADVDTLSKKSGFKVIENS